MKLLLSTAVCISVSFAACRTSSTESTVVFVDDDRASANSDFSQREDPLLLVVEIAADGKLVLNKIEVGTTADLDPVGEKLETIFEDRARLGIDQREVVIEMKGSISGRDFEKLIERLAGVRAVPIRVVKGNE